MEVLYESQHKTVPKKLIDSTIDPVLKCEINTLIYEATVKDALSFGHFRKPGMAKLLEKLAPGYKAPERHTVLKKLR